MSLYDATLPYPRDLIGYGRDVPHAQWPGGARVAVQFVLNYEEGGENSVLHGDAGSEQFLSEMFNPASFADRHISIEWPRLLEPVEQQCIGGTTAMHLPIAEHDRPRKTHRQIRFLEVRRVVTHRAGPFQRAGRARVLPFRRPSHM